MANKPGSMLRMTGALHVDNDEGIAQASRKELKNALYARCASRGVDLVFDQNDLLALGIIPNEDLAVLQACTSQLTKEGLLQVLKKDSGVCWKVVRKEDAAK